MPHQVVLKVLVALLAVAVVEQHRRFVHGSGHVETHIALARPDVLVPRELKLLQHKTKHITLLQN